MRIGVLVDSCCDLPKSFIEEHGIVVMPITLRIGAIRLIRQGATPSEIGARLRELVDVTHAYLLPTDLFYINKRASKKGEKSVGWGSCMLGSMLDVKPILHVNQDVTTPVAKVRGFDTGTEKLFANAAERVRNGLAAPFVCISYGGPLEKLPTFAGYNGLLQAAAECDVDVLVSPMSKTAAVNVGPGGVSLAFAVVGQTLQ